MGKMPGAGRLFGNRGIASGHSVSEASVTAAIIDHAEWDRAVLAEAERRAGAEGRAGGGMDPEVARRADFLARHVATHQGVSGPEESRGEPQAETPAERLSLDEIRRRNEQACEQRQADARRYWQRVRTAEQAG